MRHIIITMPIEDATLEWARENYPHLTVTQYSIRRNNYLLLSRALLEFSLSKFFNIAGLPKIDYLPHGKPYFIDHPNLAFNISHTDENMAIILAETSSLGIDIEMIRPRKNFSALENKVLKPIECDWLKSQDNYLSSFFTLWSAKEAYLKAAGTGLSGLSSLTLDLANKMAYGPLNGYLYIKKNAKKESFAYYIPSKASIELFYFSGKNLTNFKKNWLEIKCIRIDENN